MIKKFLEERWDPQFWKQQNVHEQGKGWASYGTPTQWNTAGSAIKRNGVHTLGTSKALCYIKEVRHKRPDNLLFHLYEISHLGKSAETERLVVTWGYG